MDKKIGQNFLKNTDIAGKIVKALELKKGENVLEIGPGKGILTRIVSRTNKITGVELDKSLELHIPNTDIIYGNFLETELDGFDKIISNLPYDITEPFFVRLKSMRFKKGVFMIGENFYGIIKDRIGRMGNMIWAYFDVEHIMEVSKKEFYPQPKTRSDVISVIPIPKQDIKESKRRFYREIFDQDDKKLKNALREALTRIGMTKREAKEDIGKHFLPTLDFSEKKVDMLSNSEMQRLDGCITKAIKNKKINISS
ncbi:hypothetical protein JW968_02530 [Candidatus Woesearchaeota archaeon]|nr:hypothetical protein [Candidatus Woesearchaeota archaeon]